MLLDKNPVRLNGALAEIPCSLLKPVAGGLSDRVAVAGLNASVAVSYNLGEPFPNYRFGPAPAFDPDAVAAAVESEVDRPRVPVWFPGRSCLGISRSGFSSAPSFLWELVLPATLTQEVPRRPSGFDVAVALKPRLQGMR